MNLLIDLGNTALKWATSQDPESPHTLVHGGSHHFSEKLLSALKEQSFDRVYGCSVASRDLTLSVTRLIESLGSEVKWLKAQDRFDGDFSLLNSYKTPTQLGSDRWHAALGACFFMGIVLPLPFFGRISFGASGIFRSADGSLYFFVGSRRYFDTLLCLRRPTFLVKEK